MFILFSKFFDFLFFFQQANKQLSIFLGYDIATQASLSSGREDVTALRCSEPLRSKVGGPSKVYAMFCGMGPPYYKKVQFLL